MACLWRSSLDMEAPFSPIPSSFANSSTTRGTNFHSSVIFRTSYINIYENKILGDKATILRFANISTYLFSRIWEWMLFKFNEPMLNCPFARKLEFLPTTHKQTPILRIMCLWINITFLFFILCFSFLFILLFLKALIAKRTAKEATEANMFSW